MSGGYDTSYNGGAMGDAFDVKLNSEGAHLWSTFVGGLGNDFGWGIAADWNGNSYLTGQTSTNIFVRKIDTNGAQVWSKTLGGGDWDEGFAIALDSSANAYVAGYSASAGWVSGGWQTTLAGGSDAVVMKFDTAGTALWSSYMGGSAGDYAYGIAVDSRGNAYVAGNTQSAGWMSGGWQTTYGGGTDGFVSAVVEFLQSPSNPEVLSVDMHNITWGWQDNSDDETGFRVYGDIGSGPPASVQTTTPPNTTIWNQTDLPENTRYAFQVSAVDSFSESARTPNLNVYTFVEGVAYLVFSDTATNSISVSSANTPSNLSSGSSGLYFANTSTGTSSGWQQSNTRWSSTGLTPDTQYLFEGKSRNGDGVETAPVQAVKYTLANTPFDPVATRPLLHLAAVHAIDVSIGAGDGNPAATRYAILISPPVAGHVWVQADGSVGPSAVYRQAASWDIKRVTGLARATAYTFTTIARNGEDIDTSPGPGTTLSTLDNAAPGALTLSFPTLQGDMANLVCQVSTPSVDPDGDAVVYSYDWYRKPPAGSFSLFRHDGFSAVTQSQVSNTDTQVGDEWYCVVTPSDTDLSGAPVESAHCTIVLGGTTPSSISLGVNEPSSITLGQSVTVSGQISPTPTGSGTVAFHSISPSGTESDLFPEGTFFTNGQYTKTFYPTEASEGRTAWALTSNWPGDATYMTATSPAANITVAKAQPSVSLTLNASSAPVNYADLRATVTFTTGFPSELSSLVANRTVKLYTKKPNGTSLTPLTKTTDSTGKAIFLPSDFVGANWNFDMPGTWQFRADFAGDNDFRPAASTGYDLPESVRLTLKDRAGYAIIVQGKYNALGEGQAEHAKTTDGVYRVLRARGIATEDIYYFRGAPTTPTTDIVVSDTTPTKAEVNDAVVTWARNKLRAAAAPLYIVFVDHGSVNKFYVYSGAFDSTWYISPSDLDGWLDTLESSLVGYPAADEKRVFVYGGCHSGSFIPVVSGAGRVVVTSTVTEQVSHRGVMDPADSRRDGEAFTTELFRELLGGKTLRVAFETASGKMAEYTANATNGSGATEAQRPAYDDNGDGAATSGSLSPLPGQDGAVGHVLTLGYGVNEAGSASWTGVTPTVTLTIGAPMVTLEGLCDKRPATDCTAWVEVKSPAYAGSTPIEEGTPEEDRAQEWR